MKKILLSMMAATMIFATSCENELELGAAGEESIVSFTISTPDMGSRAYSDGYTATKLEYAVYDAAGNILPDLKGSKTMEDLGAKIDLKLTTGNTYSVIFWAAAPNAPYTVDFANKTMKVNYESAVSNDENRDAFYAKETFTVTGAQTETITLKRPFAQLNIGTNDYAASTSAGYTPNKSKVVVSNVYGKLDLWEGEVDSSVVATFDFAAIDTTELFPVSGFKYLAMNYVLVPADQELTEVTFSYTDGTTAKDRTVGSVPVQRNYRTNIYGQLLTSEVDINVTIDPEYKEPANNVETIVYNATELQAALEAAGEGTTTIRLATDVEGEVTLAQKSNTEVVFDGGGNTFSGVLTIDGKSATITTAGFTVKNLTFTAPVSRAAASSSDACIRLGDGTNATRYTCNVTVENCIFDATGLVGIKSYTGGDKNLTITNCTATENAHSLVQAKGIDGVVVKNCEVKSKNGMNFNNSDNVTVEECTVDVRGYAVRFGESSGGSGAAETYLIKDSSLKSENEDGDAVIILRGTADYSTLTIENTTIEGDPQITNTATGAKVITIAYVSTADELVAALEKGNGVYLLNDITINPASMSNAYGTTGINVKNGQTIDGNGHTLNIKGAGGTWDSGINTTGGLIKNITVTGSFRGIFINHTSTHSEKVVLENVTIGGNGTVYTISCDQGMNQGIEATNCTFNGWTSFAKTAGEAKFVNCNFGEGSGYKYCRPYSNTEFVGCTFCPGYAVDTTRAEVTFTDCTWEE